MKLKLWYSLLLGLFLSNAIALPAQSQISPDGTTNTRVNSSDNTISIDEGDRAGDNLFHSFEQFSVPSGSEAFFNNPNEIVNIFSRVTGGSISEIEGLIRANGEANLFLINPAGIVFGEGAALDIGGSFTATTANSIVFSDDIEFNAQDSDNPPLLTVNMPIGLNYGNNPGSIAVNNSNLAVDSGKDLAFLGGDVVITGGQIAAPGGNIELGGSSAIGEVSLRIAENEANSTATTPKSNVTLTNGTNINVQAAGGGNISINAGNLELSGGEFGASNIIAGIASESDSIEAQAGDIVIDITGDITIEQGSSIFNSVEASAVGNAGGIDIATNNLFLTQGGQIFASTFGRGNAGAIMLKSNNTIEADGESSEGFSSGIFSRVESEAVGDSGGIDLTTNDLFLTQGGIVDSSTAGQGNAGKITLDANSTIEADGESSQGFPSSIISRVEESAIGDSGGIDLTTNDLFLAQGGAVNSSTAGEGNAGKITLDANGTIEANGESSEGFSSGIFSIVEATGRGNAGGINLEATNLSLSQGGQISASTFSQGDAGKITLDTNGTIDAEGQTTVGFPSGIFSRVESEAVGNSGGIDITTTDLSLAEGSAIETSTSGQGDAGEITLNANGTINAEGQTTGGFPSGIFSIVEDTGQGNAADIDIDTSNLSLTNGAEISVESLGQGNAGNLSIRANSLSLNRASLSALTPIGTGGNIELQIMENLTLRNNSTISALALEEANGGNINIDADFVIVFPKQNNDIIASAAVGTGGNINVSTKAIFGLEEYSSLEDNTNDLDASSEFGLDGTITIDELDFNPVEALEQLPIEIIDVASSVEQNLCQQGQGSEFVVTGKGGTATSPARVRDGSIGEVDLVKPVPFVKDSIGEVKQDEPEIIEAQGWVVNDRGMVELVARKTDISVSPIQSQAQCDR